MDIIEFSITNWEKYNPRNDRTNYSWFRFQNTFFTDPELFTLKSTEKLLLIFMFCEASKSGNSKNRLNLGMAASLLGVSSKNIKHAMEVIEKTGAASFRNQKTPKDANVWPTNERTNERTNNTPFDFDSIYAMYPKKEGKQKGKALFHRVVDTNEKFSQIKVAIKNYAKLCKSENRDKKFIKQFSTFMSCWEDYLENETTPREDYLANVEKTLGVSIPNDDKIAFIQNGFGEA